MKRSLFTHLFGGLALGLALLGTTAKAGEGGAIYTMDNATNGNHVLVFQHDEKGQIHGPASIATGGTGAGGGGLASQGSVLLSPDGDWLLVCNAGSDDISVFATGESGLRLADRVSSGGRMPVSLAMHENLVYVVNAGGLVGDKDNITAFLLVNGKLVALPGTTRALSGDNTKPGQVSFTDDGAVLVVTEETTDLIDTFTVGDDGSAENPSHKVFPSQGHTPFGFAAGRDGHIFVSNANGGAANGSSASSYKVSEEGGLYVIDPLVPTKQTAACWLTLSHDERFAYTANAGNGTISGYQVAPDGTLQLLDPSGLTASTGAGSHPVDMAESRDGRLLFALANGNGTLNVFHVTSGGSLEALGSLNGIPTSAAGLAAQ